jgi:hypothetical protein
MTASINATKPRGNYQNYRITIIPTEATARKLQNSNKVSERVVRFSKKEDLFKESNVSVIKPIEYPHKWVYDVTTETGTLDVSMLHNHNSGGVASAEGGVANAFDRAVQILRVPDSIKGAATLASVTGIVNKIGRSGYGGYVVTIAGKEHKVKKGLDLKVKIGDTVHKGDPISAGIIKPQELLGLTNVSAVQRQMREDLHETFAGAGINISKKTLEMPVKMITEMVRVTDPGDNKELVSGDYSTLARVQGWNKKHPKKRQIKYQSRLTSIKSVPHKTRDWAQRMALDRIVGTLQEGAAQGMVSRRGESTPFVELALGMKDDHTPFVDLALGPGTNLNTQKW